jgi:hypothetical protein
VELLELFLQQQELMLQEVGNWADVGTTDRRILVTNTNTGAGTGFITVRLRSK